MAVTATEPVAAPADSPNAAVAAMQRCLHVLVAHMQQGKTVNCQGSREIAEMEH